MFDIENLEEFHLDNGLKVGILNLPQYNRVLMDLSVRVGAAHDPEGQSGMAHFVEHLLPTSGCEKFPFSVEEESPSELSFTQARSEFGEFTAAASYKNSFYFVGSLPNVMDLSFDSRMSNGQTNRIELALELLSNAVFRPEFNEVGISQERSAILNEICMKKSAPFYDELLEMRQLLFGHKIYARSPLGDLGSISQIELAEIKEFHNTWYHPNNADLIIAGKLPSNIKALIGEHFGDLPSGDLPEFTWPVQVGLEQTQKQVLPAPFLSKALNQERGISPTLLGFTAPSSLHEDHQAVEFVNSILGESQFSRLYQKVREELGLAYAVGSSYLSTSEFGFISTYCAATHSKEEAAINAILGEFERMQSEPVEEGLFRRTMNNFLYSFYSGSESLGRKINFIKDYWLSGRTPQQELEEIAQLTPEKLMSVAQTYFPSQENGVKYVQLIIDPFLEE